MNQEDLADAAGVTQSYISAVERHQKWPAYEAWQAIADALECDFLELFVDPNAPSADLMLAGLSPAARRQAINVIRALKSDDAPTSESD